MASSDPGWDVPARMDGLPYTNWKRRTGYTETGTLAQMVERWLGLAWHIQAGCSIGWGPDAAGKHGAMSADGIGSFVLRVGLPPVMLKKRSRPPTREEIERYFTKPELREGPPVLNNHFNPNPFKVPK